MPISKKSSSKKTTTLGINRIPDSTTVLDIAKAFTKSISDITEIKIVTVRGEYRNALISFKSVESCENAKESTTAKFNSVEFPIFFAHSSTGPNVNISASENKVYVKYPAEESFDEIAKLFSGLSINRPENARNYFFATCSDMEEQCQVIKNFNNKKVNNGELSVKVAIDRTRKRYPIRSSNE